MNHLVNTFKQPKPFYLVWLIEFWERFGFYGMQAILVLYLVNHLGFSDDHSYNTFGAFAALLYALTIAGGYIGDKILGTKRTIVLGAFVLLLGYLFLSISGIIAQFIPSITSKDLLFHALGIIVVGNGLFKANPSALLAKIYKDNEKKIDSAFTLYYMSINLGSFLSIAITPVIAKIYNWHIAFSVSCIGLFIGIITYLIMIGWVKEVGSPPDFEKLNIKYLVIVLVGCVLTSIGSAFLLENLTLAHIILVLAGVVVLIIYVKEIVTTHGQDRANLIASLILIFEAVCFFILYQQMPTSINLFTVNNVDTVIFGVHVPPASFQALNPFWIIVGSPILAFLYTHLSHRDKDFTMPTKFAIGMFLCSISFLILKLAASFASEQGLVSPGWLVASYGFQSIGELLISGLGCAMIAKLCPQRLMGFMMGAWFMSTAAAMVLGGYVATFASVPKTVTDPHQSLLIYSNLFMYIGLITFVLSILMIALIPVLNKLCIKKSN